MSILRKMSFPCDCEHSPNKVLRGEDTLVAASHELSDREAPLLRPDVAVRVGLSFPLAISARGTFSSKDPDNFERGSSSSLERQT